LLAGLQRGVSLLILPFISRVMTPSEYGAASMLAAASVLLVAVMATPLDALVFRTVPRGGEEAPGLLRVAGVYCYVLLPVTAAFVAAGFALLVPTFLGVSGLLWAIEILAIGFQPAMTVFALPMVKACQDLRRFIWLAGGSVVFVALSKLTLVIVWQLGVLGWVISDLVSAVLSAALAVALVRPPRARITAHHVRAVARFAMPLIPHQASYWAITSLSRPALAMVSSLAQVGLLSVGLNVASTSTLAIAEINRAVQPRYARETFPAPTQSTYVPVRWQLILAVAVPAAVGAVLALVGQWVFAQAYWPSFALTGVLLIAQAAYGVYPIAINYLVLTAGLPKYSALATGTGAVVILSSIFAFGRVYGALGVAYATTAGYLAMAAVAVMLTRLTKLEIAWRAWIVCWPEITVGAAALACSVAALASPVGSASSRVFAGGCLALLLVVAILAMRGRPFGQVAMPWLPTVELVRAAGTSGCPESDRRSGQHGRLEV
jgi:O-antigen/teichoic acid export membrane protein